MKVCIVTATRADFGLLTGLAHKIQDSPTLDLILVVTGTHQLQEFGHTVDSIYQAGFSVDWTVKQITRANTDTEVALQVGKGIVGFTDAFSSLSPDMLIILGDRYEMLAAAIAGFFLKIPITHLHGGEVTHGAFDDSIRHSITKLANLHCVAHETYALRVVQLGEQPESVHVVGSLGVEGIRSTGLKSKAQVEKDLGIEIGCPLFLVTFHPVTMGVTENLRDVQSIIAALDTFKNATVVFTMPNGDPENQLVTNAIREAVQFRAGKWHFFETLGQENYWSMMAISSAVVGNSSSGVIEAPSFGVPTINIGSRQSGRLMSSSVISKPAEFNAIVAGLQKALSAEFRQDLASDLSPFPHQGAADKIVAILEGLETNGSNAKAFYDLEKTGEGSDDAY